MIMNNILFVCQQSRPNAYFTAKTNHDHEQYLFLFSYHMIGVPVVLWRSQKFRAFISVQSNSNTLGRGYALVIPQSYFFMNASVKNF